MSELNDSVIRCDHVSFRYGTDTVLHDISFDLKKGDYVGMVGSNGSGKTTLLKIILGLLSPSEGSVHLFDIPREEFRDWEKIGYVPQNVFRGDLNFPATVQEVVESGCVKAGHHGGDAALAALRRAGIEHLMKKRIGELSGGERQRVFIARALVSSPELLILDEPTTGIDANTEEKFYTFLAELNHSGITIILVSHDLEVIGKQVKTVLCLNRSLVCYGKPESLERPEILRAMYGGEKQILLHDHHEH